MVQAYTDSPAAAAEEETGINVMQGLSGAVDDFLENAQATLTDTFHRFSEFFEQQAALAELGQAVEGLQDALDEHKKMFDEMTAKLESLFREQELDQEVSAMSDAQLVAEFEAYGLATPEELAAIKADLGIEAAITEAEPRFTDGEQALIDKSLQQDELIEAAIASGTAPALSELDPFLMSEDQIAALGALGSGAPADSPFHYNEVLHYKETLEGLHAMTQDMLVQQGLDGGASITSIEDVQASLGAALAAAQTYDPATDEGIFGISGIEELTSSENIHQTNQAYFALLQHNPEMADAFKTLVDDNIHNGMKRQLYEQTGVNYNDLSPFQRLQLDGISNARHTPDEMQQITQGYMDDLKAQGLSEEQVRDKLVEELQFTFDTNLTDKALDAQWDVTDNIHYGDGYGRILDEAAAELGDIPYEFMGHEDRVTNTLATVAEFGNHTPATLLRDVRGNLEGQGLPADVVDRMEQQIQTYLGDDAMNNQHTPISPQDMADLLEVISDDVYYAGDAAREFLDTYDPKDIPAQNTGADMQGGAPILDANGAPIDVNTSPGFKP